MSDHGVCVRTACGEIEAQHIKSFLEANGIPAEIEGEALRNTHGLTVNDLGAARILVPEELAEEALALLARADAGELALPEWGRNRRAEERGKLLPFPDANERDAREARKRREQADKNDKTGKTPER